MGVCQAIGHDYRWAPLDLAQRHPHTLVCRRCRLETIHGSAEMRADCDFKQWRRDYRKRLVIGRR